MQTSENDRWRSSGRKAGPWLPALAAMLALCAGGCTNTGSQVDPIREPVQRLLPRMTEVVTGPAGALLTNLNGFHGQFTISFGAPGDEELVATLTATGELFERDGKLCFEPVFKKAKRKSMDTGAFSLIWDVAANRGYVLSDALQGFAPVAPEADGDAGKPAELRVELAKDLNGLAVRIQSMDTLRPFTLTLSDIKPGLPPPEMFVPPDGFTRYDSEGALLSELATRQRTVMGPSRRDEGELKPYVSDPSAQPPRNTVGGGY
jgi:hypothetical protein